MEGYEEDDDTHFCIKCNLTINGLNNYVQHRRSGCRPPNVKIVNEPPSTPTVSYPEILNADAFFNSLELQSSAKSNTRRAPTLLDNSRKFKKDDKRKKYHKGQDGDESGAKDKLHSMLPVSDLDEPSDLCIQSIKQTTSERKRQSWLDDTILDDLALGNNANKDLARYDFEYPNDDDSDDDMLGEELGEDSYSDSDDGENRERPPRDHTGGKWKPGLDDLPQDMPHMHEEDVEPDDDHHEHPPPTYTGGKWRPTEISQKDEEYESKNASGQPPPGHTRGKWVPGAQTDIESGYWCNPCGRKLASRLVYDRHLRSDLHARRSIRELDGGLHPRRGINSHARVSRRVSTRRQASLAARMKEEPQRKKVKKGLRRREKEILLCEMCRTRVRRPQMGKHLLSHYHCRVSGVLVNPRNPSVRRFLLEHIANVVRQSPFQCAPCHFYCNTEETFLLHWRSDLHFKTVEQIGGSCRCNPCNFWCEDNATMESHLLSTSHRDVVSMMKGSTVPVVISRQCALPCGGCDRQFRYNFQLRSHAKETGHNAGYTASDEYQQRIKCELCSQVFRSLVALQRHQLTSHVVKDKKEGEVATVVQPAPYFCSFCSMNFTTAQEAVLHRRTSSHKEAVKVRKSEEGLLETVRECPHCERKQPNLAAHKIHLLHCHPKLCHRCPRCGTLFALSQDVTRHTREGNCIKNSKSNVDDKMNVKKEWECKECIFSTDSKAEFIFHEALHAGAVHEMDKGTSGSSKLLLKYKCPTCAKIFTKTSLRNHIRQHTGEKPFPCMKCSISFSRRSHLIIHQKICNSLTKGLDKTGRRRSFICLECKEGFYT
ncbi:hypothetical protein P5V15_005928, partial [Pogonomyrmex californicus]